MTIVVKLGGTNGSGKSSVALALIEILGLAPVPHRLLSGRDTLAYTDLDNTWTVLGKYTTACGGMDTISNKEDRLQLVKQEIGGGTSVVFFEGLITGKTYGAFGAMGDEPSQKGKWLYTFMDTPFEICVERVNKRRRVADLIKGVQRPAINAECTMRPTYKSVQAVAKRAAAQGHGVLWLPHTKTPTQIAEFLIEEVKQFAARG